MKKLKLFITAIFVCSLAFSQNNSEWTKFNKNYNIVSRSTGDSILKVDEDSVSIMFDGSPFGFKFRQNSFDFFNNTSENLLSLNDDQWFYMSGYEEFMLNSDFGFQFGTGFAYPQFNYSPGNSFTYLAPNSFFDYGQVLFHTQDISAPSDYLNFELDKDGLVLDYNGNSGNTLDFRANYLGFISEFYNGSGDLTGIYQTLTNIQFQVGDFLNLTLRNDSTLANKKISYSPSITTMTDTNQLVPKWYVDNSSGGGTSYTEGIGIDLTGDSITLGDPVESYAGTRVIDLKGNELYIIPDNNWFDWFYFGADYAQIYQEDGTYTSLFQVDNDGGLTYQFKNNSTGDETQLRADEYSGLYYYTIPSYFSGSSIIPRDTIAQMISDSLDASGGGGGSSDGVVNDVQMSDGAGGFIGDATLGGTLQFNGEKIILNGSSAPNSMNIGSAFTPASTLTGSYNTLYGYRTDYTLGTGTHSTHIGYDAGAFGTGIGRTFIGSYAGRGHGGNYNTGVGYGVLNSSYSSAYNSAVGYQALRNCRGSSNTSSGYQSGYTIYTGSNNAFFGYQAGYAVNSTSNNTAIGNRAMYSGTTAVSSVAVGSQSLYLSVSGEYNTVVGFFGLYANVDGDKNTCLGAYTGYANTDGWENVFIGSYSGYNNTGDSNVFIGTNAGYNETGSNLLYIENTNSSDPLVWGDFDNDEFKINGTVIESTNTITDADDTPDVSGSNVWTYAGSANSVVVTDLDNPVPGAIYRIIGNSDTYTITINDSGNFNLSATWTGGVDDVLTLLCVADNQYIEISRSDN